MARSSAGKILDFKPSGSAKERFGLLHDAPLRAMVWPQMSNERRFEAVTPVCPPTERTGQVIPLRPRKGNRRPARFRQSSESPVANLSRFEGANESDDYRHRMTMNIAGFTVTVVLIAAGLWIADSIAELRKEQDCALSGRHNCALLHAELHSR